MTGLVILTFVPFLVAVGFLIRIRAERRQRIAVEERAQQQLHAQAQKQRIWSAALTHELRSPVAAILGYGELLEDGAFGPVEERSIDAIQRMRFAADHIMHLIDGIDRMSSAPAEPSASSVVRARTLIREAVDALHFDAQTRAATLDIVDTDLAFDIPADDAARALILALGAALKASPGCRLTISAHTAPQPTLRISGTRLHPIRDNPDHADADPAAPLSGPAFRLALACHVARLAGGSLTLVADHHHTTVILTLAAGPSRTSEERDNAIDGAEQSP